MAMRFAGFSFATEASMIDDNFYREAVLFQPCRKLLTEFFCNSAVVVIVPNNLFRISSSPILSSRIRQLVSEMIVLVHSEYLFLILFQITKDRYFITSKSP